MERIEIAMPMLFVPLVAHVLLRADGPLDKDAMKAAITSEVQRSTAATPLASRDSLPGVIGIACMRLKARNLITETDAGWQLVEAERDLLQFYANSIAHFFDDDTAGGPDGGAAGDAATAK